MGYPCLLAVTPGCGITPPIPPPVPDQDILTMPATGITDNQAMLNGMLLQDGGDICQAKFQWGGSREYGQETVWTGGLSTGSTFAALITGLSPGGYYHFRAVGLGSRGYFYGADVAFSTGVPPHGMVLIEQELADLMEGAR